MDAQTLTDGSIVVGLIDDTDLWFETDPEDRLRLPGTGGSPLATNRVSRRQARTIIRAIKARATLENQYMNRTFAEVMTEERRRVGLSGAQMDFGLVQQYLADAREPNRDLPITDQQRDSFVVVNLKALNGVEAHWWAPTQQRIDALAPDIRSYFVKSFLDVSTQGELNDLIAKYSAFVGNPPAERRQSEKAVLTGYGLIGDDPDETDDEDDEEPFS